MGWTSIYQLFWCSPGVQGFDPYPYGHTFINHPLVICYIAIGAMDHWVRWFTEPQDGDFPVRKLLVHQRVHPLISQHYPIIIPLLSLLNIPMLVYQRVNPKKHPMLVYQRIIPFLGKPMLVYPPWFSNFWTPAHGAPEAWTFLRDAGSCWQLPASQQVPWGNHLMI